MSPIQKLAIQLVLSAFVVHAAAAEVHSFKALVAPPQAEAVIRQDQNGMDTMTYRLKEPYPAATTLAFIRSSVEKQGWRPLQEDFLNPGLPSSHVRGWGTVIDGTVSPNKTLHSWHAQWTNDSGDMLLYHLKYHCALQDTRHSKTLTVTAAFIPKAIYERAKAELKSIPSPGPK